MMTFLKTILIILLIFFGLKILFRFLTPYLMKYIAKKAGAKFEDVFRNATQQPQNKQPKGDVSIDKKPNNNPPSKSTVGEYVDYEEID